MFNFCSLQGALSDSVASQSLLELDGGVKVLIDIGWDESFDASKLEELERCAVGTATTPPFEDSTLLTLQSDKCRLSRLSSSLTRLPPI